MNPIRRRRTGGAKSYPMAAAHFLGSSSQYMQINDNAALSMGAGGHPTICGWLYPEIFNAGVCLGKSAAIATATTEYLWRMTAGGLIQWLVSDGTTLATLNGPNLTLNTWNFIASYYDGATIGISVNNGAFTTAAQTTDIQDLTNPFTLGRTSSGSSPMTGSLDSIGIWKRVLTGNEFSQVYKNGIGMARQDLSGSLLTSLVAWWDLDDAGGSGATWVDKVGANHLIAGTTTNAPTSVPGKR